MPGSIQFQLPLLALNAPAGFGALLPAAASMALLLIVQGMRAGRRRAALNEAVHELRRPLQVIALATSAPQTGGSSLLQGSVHLVSDALKRLDREINGKAPAVALVPLQVEPLARSAVRRWQSRAALAGGSVRLRWHAPGAVFEADAAALSQALDNLIVNAIEHGGPSILVQGRWDGARLQLSVADSGRSSVPASRRGSPAEAIARLTGKRRHGHGLAVVRRIAADHNGRFNLWRSESASVATLELPGSSVASAAA